MRGRNENRVVNFLKTNDQKFLISCAAAHIEPTKRQASKWLNKKGKAFKSFR